MARYTASYSSSSFISTGGNNGNERERETGNETLRERKFITGPEKSPASPFSSSSSLSLCLSFFLRARLWKVGSRRCHESAAWSRWKCTGGTRESSRIRRGYLACLTRRSTYISKRGNCVVRKVRGFEVGKISDDESEFNSEGFEKENGVKR